MPQELIYTSAPRGLRPGSRGFCTVASTQGMASNLAERLEALSGYRHVIPPQDPRAHLNPIAYSHLRFSVGGREFHVLSRVGDAGLDYTQRTNKLAHHLALDAHELSPAGPARIMGNNGFMESRWEGEPRILAPAGRPIPPLGAQPAVCAYWQQVTGDAGWGGVLAQTGAGPTVQPASLIYPLGCDVLRLLDEALALLPAALRWKVTFCTYYTKFPPGVDCHWKCAVQGSPEEAALRRGRGLILDLTKPLGSAGSGAWPDAGRTGTPPAISAAVPTAPVAARPLSTAPATANTSPAAFAPPPMDYGLAPLVDSPNPRDSIYDLPVPGGKQRASLQYASEPRNNLRLIGFIALIVACCALAGGLAVMWNSADTPVANETTKPKDNDKTAEAAKKAEEAKEVEKRREQLRNDFGPAIARRDIDRANAIIKELKELRIDERELGPLTTASDRLAHELKNEAKADQLIKQRIPEQDDADKAMELIQEAERLVVPGSKLDQDLQCEVKLQEMIRRVRNPETKAAKAEEICRAYCEDVEKTYKYESQKRIDKIRKLIDQKKEQERHVKFVNDVGNARKNRASLHELEELQKQAETNEEKNLISKVRQEAEDNERRVKDQITLLAKTGIELPSIPADGQVDNSFLEKKHKVFETKGVPLAIGLKIALVDKYKLTMGKPESPPWKISADNGVVISPLIQLFIEDDWLYYKMLTTDNTLINALRNGVIAINDTAAPLRQAKAYEEHVTWLNKFSVKSSEYSLLESGKYRVDLVVDDYVHDTQTNEWSLVNQGVGLKVTAEAKIDDKKRLLNITFSPEIFIDSKKAKELSDAYQRMKIEGNESLTRQAIQDILDKRLPKMRKSQEEEIRQAQDSVNEQEKKLQQLPKNAKEDEKKKMQGELERRKENLAKQTNHLHAYDTQCKSLTNLKEKLLNPKIRGLTVSLVHPDDVVVPVLEYRSK